MSTPSFSAPASWRGTHSRATHQRARQHRSSVRFDWTHCRPLGAFACGAVSIALLANACQSFATSDDLSMILFGVSSLPFGGLCGWFLAPARPKADRAAEMDAHERAFAADAERFQELKAEVARLRQENAPIAEIEAVEAEKRVVTARMIAGEV